MKGVRWLWSDNTMVNGDFIQDIKYGNHGLTGLGRDPKELTQEQRQQSIKYRFIYKYFPNYLFKCAFNNYCYI